LRYNPTEHWSWEAASPPFLAGALKISRLRVAAKLTAQAFAFGFHHALAPADKTVGLAR
jgi:hypothetical protein